MIDLPAGEAEKPGAMGRVRKALARLFVLPGLLAVRRPLVALGIAAAVTLVLAYGALSLRTDDALGSLLRADTADYKAYEDFKQRFPANEYDLHVVLGWSGGLTSVQAEGIRDLHLDLQLHDGSASVVSMFSARDPPVAGGVPPQVFPEVLPEGGDFDALLMRASRHPLVNGRLLTLHPDGGGLALIIVNLDRLYIARVGLPEAVRQIEDMARVAANAQGFTMGITGIPQMKVEIIRASERDRVVFPALGLLVGALVCAYFFRDWRYVLMCMLPSALVVLWSIGLFGWLGLELDPVKNAILPLVMVVALTDTLHLAIAARAGLRSGLSARHAAERAVLDSGTACALTAATTAIAFLSMTLTDSDLIASFGAAAALAASFGYILVITSVPALFVLLVAPRSGAGTEHVVETSGLAAIGRLCAALAACVVCHSRRFALWGLALLAGLSVLHLSVPPYYRLSDLVPENKQAARVAAMLEQDLGGIYPISVMVSWTDGRDSGSVEASAVIDAVHAAMEATPGITNVLSPATLRRWLSTDRAASGADVAAFLAKSPPELKARFIDQSGGAAVCAGYIGDLEAREVLTIVKDLEQRLQPIKTAFPGFSFNVTDLSVMSATRSLSIIGQLNTSLVTTILVDLPTIGLAFGSLLAVVYSGIANIFAVVAMGALIFAFGSGLEYPSIIALTVTFGLTADSTIHLLNRIRMERERGASDDEAVGEAIVHVGSVLLVSTVILVLGLAVALVSDVPPTRQFGKICALTLMLALPGLLVLMPSVVLQVAALRRLFQR